MIVRGQKVFGPFWGELGWEVAQWAPYVNAHAEEGDRILCMPGHAELYADTCPISQAHPRPEGATPDMLSYTGGAPQKASGIIGQVFPKRQGIKLVKGVPCINGKLKPIPLYPGCAAPRRYVVLHCRGITKCAERNLPQERWNGVVRILNTMGINPVVIGSRQDYLPRDGKIEVDLRGASLDDTISYLRTAKVVVGASSGPMHLAQACEAPVVVWSGNAKKDRPRYQEVWNHFQSPTNFLAATWQPGVGKIMEAIDSAI